MTSTDMLKRHEKLGPGGWKCPCCHEDRTNNSGTWKAKERRHGRRRLRQDDRKLFSEAVIEITERNDQ